MSENRPIHCGDGKDDPAGATPGGKKLTRREILSAGLRGAGLLGAAGLAGMAGSSSAAGDVVWQLDPYKCIQCGNCATYCVLTPSAVRCVHAFDVCAYCKPCFGFFDMVSAKPDAGAENQLCPVGAITRTYVTDVYYQYTIDESLCIGCGKCVKGCATFGNGSLFLQIRHDLCVNCNHCAIAAACPTGAFRRVSRKNPYILKTKDHAT
ncbi:MAG: ferredoxin [Planctomycetes bacterium]|nr:ferredoxin [Planctomycetota bacterium]